MQIRNDSHSAAEDSDPCSAVSAPLKDDAVNYVGVLHQELTIGQVDAAKKAAEKAAKSKTKPKSKAKGKPKTKKKTSARTKKGA